MGEKEAFEKWYLSTGRTQFDPELFEAWQAACKWQREQDTKLSGGFDALGNPFVEVK